MRAFPHFIMSAVLLLADPSVAAEGAATIVAAQVRAQGYACKKPKDATPDVRDAKPEERAWLLQCENISYRVRLIPHRAAIIDIVDSK